MSKEIIVSHHLRDIVEEFSGCEFEEEITLRAGKITEELALAVNTWDERIYPNLDTTKMTKAFIIMAKAVREGRFREVPDFNGEFQNYDHICKSCPNYRGIFRKRCSVKRFESFGF